MTERKKRILSLIMSSWILLNTTGCSSNSIKKSIDEQNNVTYTGNVTLSSLNCYYLVEVINLNNEKEVYLTVKSTYYSRYTPSRSNFKIIGTDIILTDDYEGYDSDYGKVVNIIPFNQFISSFAELKESYTAQEILDIFECIKSDYDELIKKDSVKKLELNKKE